jgi:hypothetical protein
MGRFRPAGNSEGDPPRRARLPEHEQSKPSPEPNWRSPTDLLGAGAEDEGCYRSATNPSHVADACPGVQPGTEHLPFGHVGRQKSIHQGRGEERAAACEIVGHPRIIADRLAASGGGQFTTGPPSPWPVPPPKHPILRTTRSAYQLHTQPRGPDASERQAGRRHRMRAPRTAAAMVLATVLTSGWARAGVALRRLTTGGDS